MALDNCRTCGNPVASDAKTCPHCGAPNPGYRPPKVWLGVLMGVGLVILLAKCAL